MTIYKDIEVYTLTSWVREKLEAMGYNLDYRKYRSGPINAIFFDWKHGTFWGGSSNYGEDYGVAW